MAKRNHNCNAPTRPQKPRKDQRFLTVGLYPELKPKKAFIRICGLWLNEAGFTPGSKVKVIVENNILVLLCKKSNV